MSVSAPPDPKTQCQCAETEYTVVDHDGGVIKKRVVPRLHSCEYVRKRNALIPAAVDSARSAGDYGTPKWTQAFSQKMSELVREAMRRGEM